MCILLYYWANKKLRYRRVTARGVLSVVILPITKQQLLLLLLKSVEFDDDVELLLSVAGLKLLIGQVLTKPMV